MIDLRRTYKPSPKYGLINPLIYNIIVCPQCYYATFPEDFNNIKTAVVEGLKNTTQTRQKYGNMSFGYFDFNEERTLKAGALSFFLALSVYNHFPKEFAPSIKKGILALRASWLCTDLHHKEPQENYEKLYEYFRALATVSYDKAVETSMTGEEDFASVKFLGPDMDTNFGYEGVLYTSCNLGKEQSLYWDEATKYERYKKYRTVIAKVFGFGRTSKEKPGPLLDTARDLHESMGKFILAHRDKYETDDRSKFFFS